MACLAISKDLDERVAIERLTASARELASELRGRGGDGRIELAMYLELGEAQRSGAGESQTFSGPFIETRAWLASPPAPGTWMSRAAVESSLNLASDTDWCRLHDE